MADPFPVVDGQLDADVARDRVDVDRRVGRAADRAVDDDRILEGLAGEDVRRLQILPDHVDDAPAGLVGDLAAFAMRRGNGGAAGQAHAERLGERVHRRGGAHGVAMADRRRRGGHDLHELLVVDLAFGEFGARLPDDRARAGALAVMPAVVHRPAREHDGGNVDRRRGHDAGRSRLVAAGGEHDAVDEIAHQDFDQAEIGEIAVERRGRALARLLDRVDGEFEGHAARRDDAVAHALGEVEMVAIAGNEVGAGLGDADDRLARAQLRRRQAEIEIALDVERGHAGIVGVVEPLRRTQPPLAVLDVLVLSRRSALVFHSIRPCDTTLDGSDTRLFLALCGQSMGKSTKAWARLQAAAEPCYGESRQRARSSTG